MSSAALWSTSDWRSRGKVIAVRAELLQRRARSYRTTLLFPKGYPRVWCLEMFRDLTALMHAFSLFVVPARARLRPESARYEWLTRRQAVSSPQDSNASARLHSNTSSIPGAILWQNVSCRSAESEIPVDSKISVVRESMRRHNRQWISTNGYHPRP